MPDAWSDIATSFDEKAPNLRRADPLHPLNFWRGRDSSGRYVFQLDGQGGYSSVSAWPAPAGIEVTPLDLGNEKYCLRLTLVDADNRELFRALCSTLMSATAEMPEKSGKALQIVVSEILKWQEMLARRNSQILGPEQIIGLLGELLFLRDIFVRRLGPNAAIATWRGPHGDEQDFAFEGIIFEIKTCMATSDRRLHISSEDQLDISSGRILLCQQTLTAAGEANEASRTLNEIVTEIRNSIEPQHYAARDLFEMGLLKVGYEPKPHYDAGRWVLAERLAWEVSEDFPCITRAMLRPGVESVRYQLRSEDLHPFAIDLARCIEELVDGIL